MNKSISRLLAVCTVVALAACSAQDEEFPKHTPEEFSASTGLVAQTCSAVNIRGGFVQGTFCGGSSHAFNCTPGVMYKCSASKASAASNCVLQTVCPNGCTATYQNGDSCFNGAPSFVVSNPTLPGGSEVNASVTLAEAHTTQGIVNFRNPRGDIVAGRFGCNVPLLEETQHSASFAVPTAVVAAPITVPVYTDIAFDDANGRSKEIVSRSVDITLQPGGTAPATPSVTSFVLTPSTIAAGGITFMDATLSHMAPVDGVQVQVASADPTVASVIPNGPPIILGGCTHGTNTETLQGARHVASATPVTIFASAQGAAQIPASGQLTVQAGCSPLTCLDLPMPFCRGDDGCGGTLACGCSFGETCDGGGPGVCGFGPPTTTPPPAASLSRLTLSSASAVSGTTFTGTVTLSGPAPVGGAVIALTTSGAAATVPPSITIPASLSSITFNVSANSVSSATPVTITATYDVSQSATVTVVPVPTTTPPPGNPPPATGTSTLTVNASGRSGVTISSTPAGISVASGRSGTGTFNNGASVTLKASDGRTVIWSGACTASRDTNTCTFTINGDATVNANVK